ncbi:taste receptor type 1 member 1-like [Lissotriton helveticus]
MGSFDVHGYHLFQAMRFAIEEVNNSSALLPDVTLGYEIFDTCSESASVFAALNILTECTRPYVKIQNSYVKYRPKVMALIGPDSSTLTSTTSSILSNFLMPQIGYESTSVKLALKNFYPSFLRTIPSDDLQVSVLLHLLIKFNWTWIAVVASDNDYGRQGLQSLYSQAVNNSVCVAYQGVIPENVNVNGSAVQHMLRQINQTRVQVVVVYSSKRLARGFFLIATGENITDKVWLATEDWSGSSLITDIPNIQSIGTVIGVSVKESVDLPLKEFEASYVNSAKAQNAPLGGGCNQVCEKCQRFTTETIPTPSVSDFRAAFNVYSAVYAVAHGLHNLLNCSTGNCSKDTVYPWQLLEKIKKVSFTVHNQSISFDEKGEPLTGYDIVMWNLIEKNVSVRVIGSYSQRTSKLSINIDELKWHTKDNTTNRGTSCIILKEIRDSRAAMEMQMGTLTTNLSLLKTDHGKLADKVKDQGATLADLAPTVAEHSDSIQQIQRQVKTLMERVEDAEGRNRRNNLRVIGLPERSEGPHATEFMEQWFRDHVAAEGLSPFFCVERAHRIPTGQPRPGQPPRPLIVKILNYRDRDTLLRQARMKSIIEYENRRISLYPDYNNQEQKQRSSYYEVKKRLQTAKLRYALLFPARLKVIHDNKTHFFESPTDVEEWLEVMDIGESPDPTQGSSAGGSRDGSDHAEDRSGACGTEPKRRKPTLHQQKQGQEDAAILVGLFREDRGTINTDTEDSTVHSDSENNLYSCKPCERDQWSPPRSNACFNRTVEYLFWSDPISMILLAAITIQLLITITIAVVFLQNLDTPVVKSAGGIRCLLMLASLACACCSLYLYFGVPTLKTCLLRQPLFAISFTVCLSCIVVRSFQIVCIFKLASKAPRLHDFWVKKNGPNIFIVVSSAIQVLITIMWICFTPPQPVAEYNKFEEQILLECSESSSIGSLLEIVYIGLLSKVCFIFCYMGKDLPANYNEAKCITFSLLVYFLAWISFFTTYLIYKGKYITAVNVLAILCSLCGILSGYFVPKCYVILFRRELNTTEHFQSSIQNYTKKRSSD